MKTRTQAQIDGAIRAAATRAATRAVKESALEQTQTPLVQEQSSPIAFETLPAVKALAALLQDFKEWSGGFVPGEVPESELAVYAATASPSDLPEAAVLEYLVHVATV